MRPEAAPPGPGPGSPTDAPADAAALASTTADGSTDNSTGADKAADWTYASVDKIPNVWSARATNCRGRRYLRTTSASALLVYEALQREARS